MFPTLVPREHLQLIRAVAGMLNVKLYFLTTWLAPQRSAAWDRTKDDLESQEFLLIDKYGLPATAAMPKNGMRRHLELFKDGKVFLTDAHLLKDILSYGLRLILSSLRYTSRAMHRIPMFLDLGGKVRPEAVSAETVFAGIDTGDVECRSLLQANATEEHIDRNRRFLINHNWCFLFLLLPGEFVESVLRILLLLFVGEFAGSVLGDALGIL